MKLVLGSAQFGRNYGLVNGKKIKISDILKIETLALKKKIKFIDTSVNYGAKKLLVSLN